MPVRASASGAGKMARRRRRRRRLPVWGSAPLGDRVDGDGRVSVVRRHARGRRRQQLRQPLRGRRRAGEEQRGPAIAKPRDLTGAWAKGAPKEKVEAPKESKQMTAEEAEAEFAKLAAKMKPIESWADACSDDED